MKPAVIVALALVAVLLIAHARKASAAEKTEAGPGEGNPNRNEGYGTSGWIGSPAYARVNGILGAAAAGAVPPYQWGSERPSTGAPYQGASFNDLVFVPPDEPMSAFGDEPVFMPPPTNPGFGDYLAWGADVGIDAAYLPGTLAGHAIEDVGGVAAGFTNEYFDTYGSVVEQGGDTVDAAFDFAAQAADAVLPGVVGDAVAWGFDTTGDAVETVTDWAGSGLDFAGDAASFAVGTTANIGAAVVNAPKTVAKKVVSVFKSLW